MLEKIDRSLPCNIVIVGASGDLCKRKLIPALFALYSQDLLPEDFMIFGFARSEMTDDGFRGRVTEFIECRYVEGDKTCGDKMALFLKRCHYFPGHYDSPDDFRKLDTHIKEQGVSNGNRLFYMSIPPSIFIATSHGIRDSGLMRVAGDRWSRIVLEKPFGRDRASSDQLRASLREGFTDDQIYRIDHYLGKEVIQNLLTLRFANLILEPIWNRNYVDYVEIMFAEEIGLEGRAGYFDPFGIIRDVIQNHLMQITALVAMEQPVSLDAQYVADEKVKVLRCIKPLTLSDVTTGQYTGYLEEDGVPADSITETFAQLTLHINNPRWSGVPFYLSAGKALNTHKTEIHVKFKDIPYSIFPNQEKLSCANDLHIRVQPNEAIELHLANKVPGLGMEMEMVKLDMLYQHSFDGAVVPDAYERLLYDVLRGDHSLFIQDAELAVSWDIVTPILHELEERRIKPQPYAFGSAGPTEEKTS